MSQEHVEIVRDAFAAFRAGDIERAFAHAAPDGVTVRAAPLPDPRTYHGREGTVQAFIDWTADFDEFEMTTGEMIDAGERVVAEIFQRGTGRASGVPVEGHFWFVYTFAGGLIVRQEFFNDKRQALAAAGLAE